MIVKNQDINKLEWLQVVRAVAAFYVVLFHGREWIVAALPSVKWLHDISRYGYVGVDIFFVLSGVVVGLSANAIHDARSCARFLLKRGLRIYLGYWPILALTVAILFLGGQSVPADKALRSVSLTSASMLEHWLPVAWSLVYELYFYALTAIAFLFCTPANRLRLCILAFVALFAWHAAWWWVRPGAVIGGIEPARFLLSGHILEFLLGLALSIQLRSNAFVPTQFHIPFGGLLLVCAIANWTVIFPVSETAFFRATTLGLAGLGTILIAFGLQANGNRAPKWLVKIGDASYSLYLLHPALIALVSYIAERAQLGSSLRLLSIILIVLFSLAWYRWVEKPLYDTALRSTGLASK